MFDELKDVKYHKKMADFRSLIKYFKEKKRLKSLQKAVAYLEHKQASTMIPFLQ